MKCLVVLTFLVVLSSVYAAFRNNLIFGGFVDLDVNHKSVKFAARDGLRAVQMHINRPALSLVDIVSAKLQVILGKKYYLVILVRPSHCKNKYRKTKKCQIKRCSVEVFIHPWTSKVNHRVNDCRRAYGLDFRKRGKKTRLSVFGARKHTYHDRTKLTIGNYKQVDAGSQDIVSMAMMAVETINSMSNSLFRRVFLKVTHATKMSDHPMYQLAITMAASNCKNNRENSGASFRKCGVKMNQIETCHVTVLQNDAGMETKYHVKRFSCLQDAANTKCNKAKFDQFKKTFGRLYSSRKEEKYRLSVFCTNMKKARRYQELDGGTARYGATKFADFTEEEFGKYLSSKWDLKANDNMDSAKIPSLKLPTKFDWRSKGAVSGVKNQGSCGSCWAFSTTGNVEGQWAIQRKKLYSLSEQELVDCDKVDDGCHGGLPSHAYNAIIKLGGLETEKSYPYVASTNKCDFEKSDVVVKINGSLKISKNETKMAAWLVKNGPISIGINSFAMQFYFGGVSHPWRIFCNPSYLDHGVLIVGYGVRDGEPYWIIKNSWGADWGENGYYYIYRGDGSCGLNTACTSSVV